MVLIVLNEVQDNFEVLHSLLCDCGLVQLLVEAFTGYDLARPYMCLSSPPHVLPSHPDAGHQMTMLSWAAGERRCFFQGWVLWAAQTNRAGAQHLVERLGCQSNPEPGRNEQQPAGGGIGGSLAWFYREHNGAPCSRA
eukprot:SAG11_NODE_1003_length_6211_cov_6.104548_2_plen_138_part_00